MHFWNDFCGNNAQPGLFAVMQSNITRVTNLIESSKHFFIKSLLFKSPNTYNFIPMGNTKHTFIAEEYSWKRKVIWHLVLVQYLPNMERKSDLFESEISYCVHTHSCLKQRKWNVPKKVWLEFWENVLMLRVFKINILKWSKASSFCKRWNEIKIDYKKYRFRRVRCFQRK